MAMPSTQHGDASIGQDTVEVELGGHTVAVPRGGLYHRYRIRTDLDSRNVMEIVGHAAIEMTMNIYGHVNLKTQHIALDHLDEELDG